MTSLTDAYGEPGVLTLADVLGVDFEEESEFSTSYMSVTDDNLANSLPDIPMLVRAAPYSDAIKAAPARPSNPS